MAGREELPGEVEAVERRVSIPVDGGELVGTLASPPDTEAVVLFAHGAGSSRSSPRNRYVASVLQRAGLATLLFDLLMESEAVDRANVFDIGLLTSRLIQATDRLSESSRTVDRRIGYFGASTGAAAALSAAARIPDRVGAIVSRGGRPDLAGNALDRVRAPTLLIVGGADLEVLELNRLALQQLRVEKELAVVAGATHLFEESGALEEVASLATAWFDRYLRQAPAAERRVA